MSWTTGKRVLQSGELINELFNQVFTRTVHKAIENYFYFSKKKIFHFPIVDNRFPGIVNNITLFIFASVDNT